MKKTLPVFMSFVTFFLVTMFYFFDYLTQVVPGVFADVLTHSFSLDAEELSILSASYFLSYTFVQLPAGFLYDKFGGRLVVFCSLALASLGSYLFSITNSLFLANLSRILMGGGSAFAFLGALYFIERWFPKRYFATLAGVVALVGSLGAMFGEIFLVHMLHSYGWRETMVFIALFGFLLAISIGLLVKNHPFNEQTQTKKETKISFAGEFRYLFSHSQIWGLSIYCFLNWSIISVFAVLWGIPYLIIVYNISLADASLGIFILWIGVGIGSPLIGWTSDFIKLRKPPMIFCSLLAIIAFIIILYVPHYSIYITYTALLMLGIAASGPTVVFATAKDIVPIQARNLCNAFINMMAVVSGLLLQPLVGSIMDILWLGNTKNSIQVYMPITYKISLSVLFVASIISLIIQILWIKETHCKDLTENLDKNFPL